MGFWGSGFGERWFAVSQCCIGFPQLVEIQRALYYMHSAPWVRDCGFRSKRQLMARVVGFRAWGSECWQH